MPVATLFPLVPLLLLCCSVVIIALISIILDSFENQSQVDSGLFVLIGCILTVAIIGFFVALSKTVEAFMLKDSLEEDEQSIDHLKLKKISIKDFMKYITKLLLLLSLSVAIVALASVIVEKGEFVSNSSFVFAAVILAISAFSTLLMTTFTIIRCIEYFRISKADVAATRDHGVDVIDMN